MTKAEIVDVTNRVRGRLSDLEAHINNELGELFILLEQLPWELEEIADDPETRTQTKEA